MFLFTAKISNGLNSKSIVILDDLRGMESVKQTSIIDVKTLFSKFFVY